MAETPTGIRLSVFIQRAITLTGRAEELDAGDRAARRVVERLVIGDQRTAVSLRTSTALDSLGNQRVQGFRRDHWFQVSPLLAAARIGCQECDHSVRSDRRRPRRAPASRGRYSGSPMSTVVASGPVKLRLRLEERRLWRRRGAGDRTARDALVEQYLPLARMLARRYGRTAEPLDDLEQVACLGLVQAVDRFDPTRGIAFGSFAVPTILGELRRHFRDRTWSVRVPRSIREAAIAVDGVTARLVGELGRMPSAREVAEATGLPLELVLEAREAALAYRTESLDRPLYARGEDGAATLGERLSARDDLLGRAEDGLLIDQLAAAALPPRDREIVRLRFSEDLLQREIADRLGISQMHVSRILRAALVRLREQAARTPVERAARRAHRSP